MKETNGNKKKSQEITKDISDKIKPEVNLVGWKNKKTVEKRLNIIVYDILSELNNNKNDNNFEISNSEDLTYKIIELAKRDLK